MQIPSMTRDLNRIAKGLSAVFPELATIPSVTRLGEGFRCLAVETPGRQVFKIGKNWEASAGFSRDVWLLRHIRDLLPAPIPYPVWHAGSSTHFPFGVLGYPKLDGTPLDDTAIATRSTIADGVARFLLALHHIPEGQLADASLPTSHRRWSELKRVRDRTLSTLREALGPGEYRAVERWWASFLIDPAMREFTPALQHGDLWHGNMLTNSDRSAITGILDFENAAIGDPAQDFATQLHLGRDFAEAVLDRYQAAGGILDGGLRYRMQRLWELREFDGMDFAIRYDDQHEFNDSLRKLRQGPILDMNTRRDTAIWQPPAG